MNDVKDEKNIHLRSVQEEKSAFAGNDVSKKTSWWIWIYVFHYINRFCVQDHQFINDQNGTIRYTVNCTSYITFIRKKDNAFVSNIYHSKIG